MRILNVIDGCIPSDMATGTVEEIEEERRLLHVAMTRAKDELDLIIPQRFFTYNQAQSATDTCMHPLVGSFQNPFGTTLTAAPGVTGRCLRITR